ncbi:hypothetical protein C2845_PM01G17070 [Panicum miliaceum]|uniref:Uncharacterized protein n=1 Tax=Panicum miliaceum TaxID=4540 RepID=A0A3L6TTV7_PANMI|nr:hypothetical protein C2845_PM01G17070 [Panicum miliaceum]
MWDQQVEKCIHLVVLCIQEDPTEKGPVHDHFLGDEFCVQSIRVHQILTASDITERHIRRRTAFQPWCYSATGNCGNTGMRSSFA